MPEEIATGCLRLVLRIALEIVADLFGHLFIRVFKWTGSVVSYLFTLGRYWMEDTRPVAAGILGAITWLLIIIAGLELHRSKAPERPTKPKPAREAVRSASFYKHALTMC